MPESQSKVKPSGYCLVSPTGRLIPRTFGTTRDDAWNRAFVYLYTRSSWMKPFYKQWQASIKAAEARGWKLMRVALVEYVV